MNRNGNCDAYNDAMADVLFGGATEAETRLWHEHLATCDDCRNELAELDMTLGLAKLRERKEPEETFWIGFHDRVLERALIDSAADSEKKLAGRPPVARGQVGGSNLQVGRSNLVAIRQASWIPRLVAALFLIGVGFGIGKLASAPPPAGGEIAAHLGGEDPAAAHLVSADAQAHDLLARSEMVLLQFVNEAGDDQSAVQARELGRRAEIVKASLAGKSSRTMTELVRELEFVLLQIANLDAAADSPGVELVRSTIDRRALLFRINRQQLRAQGAGSARQRAPDAAS